MADNTREWGWSELQSEEAHGPFGARSECLADAIETLRGATDQAVMDISVGRVRHALPEEHIRMSGICQLNTLLEEMDTNAMDDGFGFADREIFKVERVKEAQESLDALLGVWAKAWVVTDVWAMEEPIETVQVALREAVEAK